MLLKRFVKAAQLCKEYGVRQTPETIGWIVWGEVEDPNDFYFIEVVESYLKKARKLA